MVDPIGAVVKLWMDWEGDDPPPVSGDCIATRAGSHYVILESHASRRPCRYVLACQKVAEPPHEARVIAFRWYPRKKRPAC